MARTYDASNETRVNVLELKKNNRGDYFKVDMILKHDTKEKSVDLRNYYTNDKDEICPTQKGVRIKSEDAYEIIVSMLDVLEANEIMDVADYIEEKMKAADKKAVNKEKDSTDKAEVESDSDVGEDLEGSDGMTQQGDD